MPRLCFSLFYYRNTDVIMIFSQWLQKEISMFTKLDAIKIVCNAAKIYHKKLANKNFLVIYKNRSHNAIECFEILFLPRNFLHLTGLTYINPQSSSDLYRKCLSNNLSENDFTFKETSLYSTVEYHAKGISNDTIRNLKAIRNLINLS